MKLNVFPNDPLKSYLEKGEIKPRYFNPIDLFDEIHVTSLFESDVELHLYKKIKPRPEWLIEKLNLSLRRKT